VSHDCDILSDDTPSHFYIFVFVCRIEMSIIPLQTKIDLIENVVILSFGVPSPFTLTLNDDYMSSRIAWIRTQIDSVFPNHSDAEKNQLMFLSNTIPTLEKAEDKLAEAKAERAAERQFLLQQGLQQGDKVEFHSFVAQLQQGKLLFCFILILLFTCYIL
jgi:hypothetical protein